MRKGRGKGKKLSSSNHEDPGSGEEEKLPTQKRRGRPQKSLRDEFDEEDAGKMEEEEEDREDAKVDISTKEIENPVTTENEKKRKRNLQVRGKSDHMKEEKGVVVRSSADNSIKLSGFRQNGSRRKSKPRRAAEVGVECK